MKCLQLYPKKFIELTIVVVIQALESVQDAPLRKLLLLLRDMGEERYCSNIRVLAYGSEKLWKLAYQGRRTPEISPFNRAVRYLIQNITVDELIDLGVKIDDAETRVQSSGNGVPAFYVAQTEKDESSDDVLRRIWANVSHPAKKWLINFARSGMTNHDYFLVEDPERCPVPSLDDQEEVFAQMHFGPAFCAWIGFRNGTSHGGHAITMTSSNNLSVKVLIQT